MPQTKIQKLRSDAKKLNIEVTETMTEEELSTAIAAAKPSKPVEPVNKEPEVKEKNPKKSHVIAKVVNASGATVRVYDPVKHGESFADLADSFAEKNGYTVVIGKDRDYILCPQCGGKIYTEEA